MQQSSLHCMLWLALSCAWPGSVSAQTYVPPGSTPSIENPQQLAPVTGAALSLTQALARLAQHPELLGLGHEIRAAEAALAQAAVLPNPEFGVQTEDLGRGRGSLSLQVSQTIALGNKRATRRQLAQRQLELAQLDYQHQQASLRAELKSAFYQAWLAQEAAIMARQSAQIAGQAHSAIEKLVRAGKNSPPDQTRAEIAQAQAELALAQAEHEQQLAYRKLAATYAGKLDFSKVQAVSALPELPALPLVLAQVAQAPARQRAQLDVQYQQAMLAWETSRAKPDLTLSIGNKHERESGRKQWLFGVSLPLTLFDRNQGNLAAASARLARSGLQEQRSGLDSELAVRQTYANLQRAGQEFTRLQEQILPLAERSYQATRRGFELHKFSFLDLLDAQRTLFESRKQSLRALLEAHQANAELEKILGRELANLPKE